MSLVLGSPSVYMRFELTNIGLTGADYVDLIGDVDLTAYVDLTDVDFMG